MNTPENLEAKAEKKIYSLQDSPWYFGAYLSQARHNLYITLNDLTEKIGYKPIPDDGQIAECKSVTILSDPKGHPVELEKVMKYFEDKFHFIFAMHYKYSTEEEKNIKKELRDQGKNVLPTQNTLPKPQNYHSILKLLIKTLNEARNHFSHYTEERFKIDPAVCYLLNDSFDVNIRIVKHRFKLEEIQLNHLRRYEPSNGRSVKLQDNPAFKYKFMERENEGGFFITEFGLAFLISLFLPKGDAFLFLKKIDGLKRGDTPEYKATVEAFCTSTMRLPKERMESDLSQQATFLDMVNELSKCPKELFEHLDPEKQKLFITRTNNELSEYQNEDDNELEPDSKMVRKNDRFVFFAQRYLDINNSFNHLRFGVDLGTFYYSLYPKEIVGHTEIRRLTKHLIGYGRLEDFEKSKRPNEFAQLYADISAQDETQRKPYIKETYPHYQVENNNIPVFNTAEAVWPSIKTLPTYGEKSYPNKLVKDTQPKPFAYIPVMEMQTLLFYTLLQAKNGQGIDSQSIITKHVENIKKLFRELVNGSLKPVADVLIIKPGTADIIGRKDEEYNKRFLALTELLVQRKLKPSHLPEKVIAYLLGIEPKSPEMKFSKKLELMIAEAEGFLDTMEMRENKSKETKPGKKNFRKIKVGKLADILTADMMLMQPVLKDDSGKEITSSKANATVNRLIQSQLAYYGLHKQEIRKVFVAADLLNSQNPHPFLKNLAIENFEGIIEFYKAYYREKIKYLKGCQKNKKYEAYYFLRGNKNAEIKVLAKSYLNDKNSVDYTPANLPRGLFLDACIEWLCMFGSDNMKTFLSENKKKINSVHLITYYFETECNDKEQPFYAWPRGYNVYGTKTGKHPKQTIIQNYLTLQERVAKSVELKKKKDDLNLQIPGLVAVVEEAKKEPFNLRNYSTKYKLKDFVNQKFGPDFSEIYNINWNNIDGRDWQIMAGRKIIAALERSLNDNYKYVRDIKYFAENESYLRLISVQDKLIFLCIHDILLNQSGGLTLKNADTGNEVPGNSFQLQNISPVKDNSNKNILDCTPIDGIRMKKEFYRTDNTGTFVKTEGKLALEGIVTIVDRHVKIKNAGNFKKLARDRRLNNLCFYFEQDENGDRILNRMVLENELKEFDQERHKVLEKVSSFEKAIYQKFGTDFKKYLNSLPKLKQGHNAYLDYFFTKFPEPDESDLKNELSRIRNGFLHSQFPLLQDEEKTYLVPSAVWKRADINFQPSATGSTLGYEIIIRIADYAIKNYDNLILKL